MGIDNPVHILFIGIVALVVLGPKRLPELAKALGNGLREFRESVNLGEHQHNAPPTPPAVLAQPAPVAPAQAAPVDTAAAPAAAVQAPVSPAEPTQPAAPPAQ